MTQDDDLFTELDLAGNPGILFQKYQTLSARDVGDIVDEMSQYLEQSAVGLEYVSPNWSN